MKKLTAATHDVEIPLTLRLALTDADSCRVDVEHLAHDLARWLAEEAGEPYLYPHEDSGEESAFRIVDSAYSEGARIVLATEATRAAR